MLRHLERGCWLFLVTLVLSSCKSPEPAAQAYQQEIIQPALRFQSDIHGEAPKRVIRYVYLYYQAHHGWPKDYSTFQDYVRTAGGSDCLSGFVAMTFASQDGGDCKLTMTRSAYSIEAVLPKPDAPNTALEPTATAPSVSTNK